MSDLTPQQRLRLALTTYPGVARQITQIVAGYLKSIEKATREDDVLAARDMSAFELRRVGMKSGEALALLPIEIMARRGEA